MKLVVVYTDTDGYTYSCQRCIPVDYVSAENFLVEFEEACKQAFASRVWEFQFGGHTWDVTSFMVEGRYYDPHVYELEDWFDKYSKD